MAFSRDVVAKGDTDRLGTDAEIWDTLEASCFQARSVGAEGTATGLEVGMSKAEAFARVTEEAEGDEGSNEETLVSTVLGKDNSEFPFTAPPSVRKWKLWQEERHEHEAVVTHWFLACGKTLISLTPPPRPYSGTCFLLLK